MPEIVRELNHAARRLRRAPVFAITTIVVLALGIGATTAVFSIVDGVLIRPLPFPHPERLFDLAHTASVAGVTRVDQAEATFLLYQRHAKSFHNLGAYRPEEVSLGALEGSTAEAERVESLGVTSSLLATLGIPPLRGRSLTVDDDRPGAPLVVMISEGLWRRRFGADPNIVGKRILIDAKPKTIVGIMPASFRFPSATTQIWRPLQIDPAHAQAGSFNYQAVGRLRDGVTPQTAAAEINVLVPTTLDEFPSEIPKAMWKQANLRADIRPLRDVMVGDVSRLLWTLMGTVALVLLIACANVANLFLVRAEGRQRELAIRSALGAGRGVLVSQYLAESAVIASVGGIVGIALAVAGVRALAALPAGINLPRMTEIGVDAQSLLFALAVTVLSTVIVSLVPLSRLRRIAISTVLRESDRAATTGAARQRARSAFVVVQVAMALVLVAGSGLMARSFARLRDVKPGFDPTNALTMRVAFPLVRYPSGAGRLQYLGQVTAKIKAIPGVRSVGLTDYLPLIGDHSTSVVEIEDRPLPPNAVPPVHDVVSVTGDYFAAMGIPIVMGRAFAPLDPARPTLEVMVTRSYAEHNWKGQSPLGKRIRPDIGGPWFTIVGVIADMHIESLESPPDEALYMPLATSQSDSTYVPTNVTAVIRAERSIDAASLSASVRRAFHDIDPALPLFGERTLAKLVSDAFARTRFTMLLLAVASGIALVLGAVGIYGVMAYGVSLRRREIGVRMALGARPSDVSWMVSRQGLVLGSIGVVAGLVGAFGATRALRGLLYDVSPADPLTLSGAAAALLAVSLIASWIPARRAAAVDPAESLRSE